MYKQGRDDSIKQFSTQQFQFTIAMTTVQLEPSLAFPVALFPGHSHLQSLIAYGMQIFRETAWEVWSRAVMSVDGGYTHG